MASGGSRSRSRQSSATVVISNPLRPRQTTVVGNSAAFLQMQIRYVLAVRYSGAGRSEISECCPEHSRLLEGTCGAETKFWWTAQSRDSRGFIFQSPEIRRGSVGIGGG